MFFCENNWKREGHKNKNKNKKQKYKSNNNKFIVCLFLNKKQTTTKRRKKNVKNQNKIIKIDKNFLNKNSYTLAKFFFTFFHLAKILNSNGDSVRECEIESMGNSMRDSNKINEALFLFFCFLFCFVSFT